MRFAGKLGIAQQAEVRPGIWEEAITEHEALGDLRQRTEALDSGDSVLPRYRTTTSVSVPARGVGQQDNSMIRYVSWKGKRWTIASIVDEPPKIVLFIGEEYHGPHPD